MKKVYYVVEYYCLGEWDIDEVFGSQEEAEDYMADTELQYPDERLRIAEYVRSKVAKPKGESIDYSIPYPDQEPLKETYRDWAIKSQNPYAFVTDED